MIFIAGNFLDESEREYFDKAEAHLIETERAHRIYGTDKIINIAKVLESVPFLDYQQTIDLLLRLLSYCDTIYMLKGWESNIDVKLLHDYACNCNYKVIYSKKF